MHKSTVLIGLIVLLAGCTSPRQMALLQGNQSAAQLAPMPSFRIAQGDQLHITFSAINPEAVAPYNSAGTSYYVDNSGEVLLPVIGAIHLEGLTTQQAQDTLQILARAQAREALASVVVDNAVVTVLGEVKYPTTVKVTHPVSLLEVLGQVGGLTRNANCKNVLVQRMENNQVRRYRVNLLTTELYTSPCYYVQKGDVVVVSPLHTVSVR